MVRGPSALVSKSRMKPSSLRTFAIATLIFEDGMSTLSCFAETALRIRVSISAMGSVIDTISLLPARLRDAGDLTLERQLAEANAAQREVADVASRPAAQLAAVAMLDLVLRRTVPLDDHRNLGHVSSPSRTAYP